MKRLVFAATPILVVAIGVLALAGCRARVVKVTLINTSAAPISTIIVDYPNATFGKDKLAPGETFSYTIKPLDRGPLQVRFADAQGINHAYKSVSLQPNDDGWVNIKLTQTSGNTGFDITRSGNK